MPSWKSLKDVKVKDVVYWSRQRKRKADEMEGADVLKEDLTYVVPEKSIGFALDLMGQHNVLTIPIISNYGDPEKETYHGQLDVLRIAGLLLDELGSTKPESTDYNSVCQQLLSASIDDLVKQNRGLLPEDDVTYTEDLLAFAVRHVFTSNAYHRVTVFSSSQPKHAIGMLTQNDILLFFNKFPELMGPQADATLDELGLCNSSIRVINHNDMVLSAFGMMFDHHVREIPVVDDDGKLIGAFNCGVLRGMTSFTGLNMSIGQFAKEYPLRPATPCTKLDKLKDIVARIAEDRRIRSYGVNDKSQPIFDVMLNNMLVSLVNSGWELKDVTVNDIVKSLKKNSPLLLDYDTTLGDCLKEMASHNILTTPVLNPRGAYHGMVDVRDILFEVLDSLDDHYKGTLRETEHAANLYQFSASDRSIIEEVFQRPLRNLTFTRKDMCQLSENILEVLKNCFIPNNFHCVTSFDAAGKIVSTLTQRDIAKFISQYPDILGEAGRKTVEELGLIQGFLRTLHQREPTIEAFRIMREFSVSAVPIVNSVGKLVTCVDSGDLRGLSNFYGLRLMTAFFKSSVPNPEDYPPDQIPVPMPLTCKPTDTLKDILFRIVETSHRRVWCVDDEGRPKCSISLTKILKLMACPSPVEKDSTKFARV